MALGHVPNTMLRSLELQSSELQSSELANALATVAAKATSGERLENLVVRVNQGGSWPDDPQRGYRGTNKLPPLGRHEAPPKRSDPNQEPGSWPTQSQREKDFNDSMPVGETAELTAGGIALVIAGYLLSCRFLGPTVTMAALKSELAAKLGITLTGVSLVEFGKWFDAAWNADGNPEKIRDAQDAFKIWASAAGPLAAAKALREFGGASQAITSNAPAAATFEPAGNNWLAPLMNERGGMPASIWNSGMASWIAWLKAPKLSRMVIAEINGTPWDKMSLQERGEAVGRAVNAALRERGLEEVRVNVIVDSKEIPAAVKFHEHYVVSPGNRSITVNADVLPITFERPDMRNIELEGGMAWLLGNITQKWSAGRPHEVMSKYVRKLFGRQRAPMVE